MSKPKTPQYGQTTAPTVTSGNDLYNQGINFLNQNGLGYTLSAQGNALQEAQSPSYYNSFQPSSFAQALGNQSFQNIWPNEQAAMQNQQSLTGQAYSPGASAATGEAYGNLATGIGEYLNQQGMQEAQNGINAGLGINPNEVLSPYVQTAANQSNLQNSYNYGAQQQNNQANYANSMANYNQQMGLAQGLGTLGGAGLGFAVGGPAGASIGAGLGGSLYGSQNSMANYMQAMSNFNAQGQNQPFGGLFSGGGGGQSWTTGGYNTGFGAASSGINSSSPLSSGGSFESAPLF